MKKILPLKLMLVLTLLFLISACCEPKILIQKEYVACVAPVIVDLNYTNDTNYTIEPIKYEVLDD